MKKDNTLTAATAKKRLQQIMNDPVLWAKTFLVAFDRKAKKEAPWHARWYQAEMLRDQSRKKVYLNGRRTGKCLPGHTRILDPLTGRYATIRELFLRGSARVLAYNEQSGMFNVVDNCTVCFNGKKPIYRVVLSDGRYIEATGNHPLYRDDYTWVDIDHLQKGDFIAVPGSTGYFGTHELTVCQYKRIPFLKEKEVLSIAFSLSRFSLVVLLRQYFLSHNIDDVEDGESFILLFRRLGITTDEIESFISGKIEPRHEEQHIQFMRIRFIIDTHSRQDTYDLTVPKYHNFVAQDIIVHNTETMCVESLYESYTNQNYVCLFATPYESQVSKIFKRLNELIGASPLLKSRIKRRTNAPFLIEFDNKSQILGFTTGAKSGKGAVSLRGQRADSIYLDEMDYMADADFDTINALTAEHADIRVICSSTPSGHRGNFYNICVNPSLGYTLHHHPSHHNPEYTEEMDEQQKISLSETGYQHEILAEFGEEEAGVFNKTNVDMAAQRLNYAYNELTTFQREQCLRDNSIPYMEVYTRENPYRKNPFVTMGVDWDKYGASSSLLILEYDRDLSVFKVLKRYEMSRQEYSYDNAVNKIIELNDIYNPAWIYADRGSGEYQIERLHIYGDEHPSSGLKVKLKGWSFANTIDILDPITRETSKKPMKPFMVNQLANAFERNKIILSPYDETLKKQLIDYTVERVTSNGLPIYTSKDEHFVDALGLAYLAFVLEFPNLTAAIKKFEPTSTLIYNSNVPGSKRAQRDIAAIERHADTNPWDKRKVDPYDLPGDKPKWFKVTSPRTGSTTSWGSRGRGGFGGRSNF